MKSWLPVILTGAAVFAAWVWCEWSHAAAKADRTVADEAEEYLRSVGR